MFVTIYQPGDGRPLAPEAGMLKLGFRTGSRHGIRGMRPAVGIALSAPEARELFAALKRYSEHTGYTFRVEVNAAESKALNAGGLVDRYGVSTTYRISNYLGRAVVS